MTAIIGRLAEWLLDRLAREKHEIARKGLDRYMTRWTLWGQRFGDGHKLFVHLFYQGDPESYPHDHPWPFWSLIIWGGYFEHTESGRAWYGPGRLLRRPAEWRHRVEVPEGQRCWTLFWAGPKVRSWYFWCPGGTPVPWRVHQANQEAGLPGCGEE